MRPTGKEPAQTRLQRAAGGVSASHQAQLSEPPSPAASLVSGRPPPCSSGWCAGERQERKELAGRVRARQTGTLVPMPLKRWMSPALIERNFQCAAPCAALLSPSPRLLEGRDAKLSMA